MAEQGGAADRRLRVFLSYSRKDQAFADDLVLALDAYGFDANIDRDDIAPGEAWEERLGRLIEEADTVVFAVSPDAVASPRCGWEVERTEALGKRLIPVVCRETAESAVPDRLKRLNFIFFAGRDASFGKGLSGLVRALNTDIDWIREHTRLAEFAARWQVRGRREVDLLRGADIDDARAWLARRPKEAPEPTEAHREFIAESEAGETARNSAERQRLAAVGRVQRRFAWALAAAAVLVLGFLGFALHQSYQTQVREAAVLTSLAQRAIDEGYYDRAMRIALQGLPPKGSIPWMSHWSPALEAKLAGGALLSPMKLQINDGAPLTAAEFSPDSTRVATASLDGSARIWDASTGNLLTTLTGHNGEVYTVAFSPDGQHVITGSSDKTARVWNATDGMMIASLEDHEASVTATTFSAEGDRVLTIAWGKNARVWNVATGKLLMVLEGHEDVITAAAFSPDGRRMVTASHDKTARVWDAATGKMIAVLRGHTDSVSAARFSPDGKKIVTASWDKTARVWELSTSITSVVLLGHEGALSSAVFCSDGERILTASNDGTARLWNVVTGRQSLIVKGARAFIKTAAFSPRCEFVVTLPIGRKAQIVDTATGGEVLALRGHDDVLTSIAFSPDGRWLVTASRDQTARVWDVRSGQAIVVLAGHAEAVSGVAFSPDSQKVVTASHDKTARVWNINTGDSVSILAGHNAPLVDAAFSPDGNRVVTASLDTTARVWIASTGIPIAMLKGQADAMKHAAFTPNGDMVVTVSESWLGTQEKVRLWDPATGSLVTVLADHERAKSGTMFSTDGGRLLKLSPVVSQTDFNHAINIPTAYLLEHEEEVWIEASGYLVPLKGHTAPLITAAFNPDGSRIATASWDRTARVWDVSWATTVRGTELRDRVCAEKLIGAQAFTLKESEDPILAGLAEKSPCDRRGPLALTYWTALAADVWHAVAGKDATPAQPQED